MISHIPVLTNQVIRLLDPRPGKVFIDATLGLGGHTEALLQIMGDTGAVYGVDVDERNLSHARERLKKYSNVHFIHGNFETLAQIGESIVSKEGKIDGILLDLGLSSVHVDEASRGFSFQQDGPLDMRFDTRQRLTAADIVNTYSAEELAQIFKLYGEEKFSNKIANEIVRYRKQKPFETTSELADFIAAPISEGKDFYFKRHPATRVFQALRIATNREIEVLVAGLNGAAEIISKGGRLVVISYHSLEDRVVKNFFRDRKKEGALEILTKKPVCPDEEEVKNNRRSRSAKLRAAEKL